MVKDLSIWPLCEISRQKSENLDPRMRKCDGDQTLVRLDVHVCPVFVCVCVGGGTLIYINIYPKIKYFSESPQNIEIKRF